MLDFNFVDSTWEPKPPDFEEYYKLIEIKHTLINNIKTYDEPFFVVVKYEPDIVGYWFTYEQDGCMASKKRYVFHEGYFWDWAFEKIFDEFVRNESSIFICPYLDEIYIKYSQLHDDWHLQRYYKRPVKMLDHIYHCMKRNTVKELLYKAGMDELAVYRNEIEDLNLLATSPSKVFDGINNKILRLLNSKHGAMLLSGQENRRFIESFIKANWWIVDSGLNDFQCEYLLYLKHSIDYRPNYTVHLNTLRKLQSVWTHGQYRMLLEYEKKLIEKRADYERFEDVDPIFVPYLKEAEDNYTAFVSKHDSLYELLVTLNEVGNKELFKSNSERMPELEEQDDNWIIKYPSSIEEFCRTAVYFRNCLLRYVWQHIFHDCDIVFIYKNDNRYPYIVFRIDGDSVVEARYRFNIELNESHREMLKVYCQRHNLKFEIDEARPF